MLIMMIIILQYIDVVEVLQVANNKPKIPEFNLKTWPPPKIFPLK